MQDSLNVSGMPQNDATPKEIRTRSTFPLSYHMYETHRFAEYAPHYVIDGVPGDRIPLSSSQRVDSFSLKAPLMQDISLKKDYYMVPLEAILPKNFDKWYTNPVVGDDCPDDAGTGVDKFWNYVGPMCTSIITTLRTILSGTGADAVKLTAFFRGIVTMEYFYSNGSLMTALGCHGASCARVRGEASGYYTAHGSFDEWFDNVCAALLNTTSGIQQLTFSVDGRSYYVYNGSTPAAMTGPLINPSVSFRDMLQYFRDDLTAAVTAVTFLGSGDVNGNVGPFLLGTHYTFLFDSSTNTPFDARRLWAYQLICSHFYSNDHIDYIYSAELYRQLIHFYLREFSATPVTFTMNGMTYEYDYMSGHNLLRMITAITADTTKYLENSTTAYAGVLGYMSALFSFRRSLRFMDYFTGARSRPLAVGDVNVDVQTGTPNFVSVIDTTQSIQKQKFLNAVNRFGRKFEEYIKGLSGVEPHVDYHNPLYLSHTSDSVFAREVENTGAGQLSQAQSVTSRLASSGGRFRFEFSCDRPCVVIGLTYFDIARVYKYSMERPFFHLNRFDDFNPFMQFIGDQPVYSNELGRNRTSSFYAWAYQLRHMEYKQRFSQAVGGFVHSLPGYIFDNEADNGRVFSNINPDYIRSTSSELDPYYVSLTGYSLGTYFHFLVDHFNESDASRPMAYAPSIL